MPIDQRTDKTRSFWFLYGEELDDAMAWIPNVTPDATDINSTRAPCAGELLAPVSSSTPSAATHEEDATPADEGQGAGDDAISLGSDAERM